MSGIIERIVQNLPFLSEKQLEWIESVTFQFLRPHNFERLPDSDLINDHLLQSIGDGLRIHHCFSSQPLTKDKFEYLLETAAKESGMVAKRAPRGNPGYDLIINEELLSLKTQADQKIKEEQLHISKFMELGKGEWTTRKKHFLALKEQFFAHMEQYDRIFSLRALSKDPQNIRYELVEIPKDLLLEAEDCVLKIMTTSKQKTKPAYCTVYDEDENIKFQLYFDGGGERKLQIKKLAKQHCIVHATWTFSVE